MIKVRNDFLDFMVLAVEGGAGLKEKKNDSRLIRRRKELVGRESE